MPFARTGAMSPGSWRCSPRTRSLSFLPTVEILSRPGDFGDARRWPGIRRTQKLPGDHAFQCSTTLDGLRASAVTDCLVHELSVDETAHTLMIVAIRYLDSLVKKDGKWLIRQRQVAVDWT